MKKGLLSTEQMVKLLAEHGRGLNYTVYISATLRRRGNAHHPAVVRELLNQAVEAGYVVRGARRNGTYGYRWDLTAAGRALAEGTGG